MLYWVNTWPNPSEQFAGLDGWINGGGGELLESLPVTNSRQELIHGNGRSLSQVQRQLEI